MTASSEPSSTKCHTTRTSTRYVYEIDVNSNLHEIASKYIQTCQDPALDLKRPGEEISGPGLLILRF